MGKNADKKENCPKEVSFRAVLRTDGFTVRSPDHDHCHKHWAMADGTDRGSFAVEAGFGQATLDFLVRLRTKLAISRKISRLFGGQFVKRFLSHFKLSFFKHLVECAIYILAHLYNKVNSNLKF